MGNNPHKSPTFAQHLLPNIPYLHHRTPATKRPSRFTHKKLASTKPTWTWIDMETPTTFLRPSSPYQKNQTSKLHIPQKHTKTTCFGWPKLSFFHPNTHPTAQATRDSRAAAARTAVGHPRRRGAVRRCPRSRSPEAGGVGRCWEYKTQRNLPFLKQNN